MKFRVEHPTLAGVRADYGFDTAIGFFADIVGDGRRRSYDALQPGYDHERPLLGALLFIVQHGFFTLDELHAALATEAVGGTAGSTLPRVTKVVSNFKLAAD